MINIQENLNMYMLGFGKNRGRHPLERYSSFDYCFNYFQSFYNSNKIIELSANENMQNSCLQLGFYLASWGMYRGSSFILEKSVKFFEPLIKKLSKMEKVRWEIDVGGYTEENIDNLIRCFNDIKSSLKGEGYKVSQTLITKIMLGVFGCVPAFDTFFCKGIKTYTYNAKSLTKIQSIYSKHKEEIENAIKNYNLKTREKAADKISTYDFLTEKDSKINYTNAKIVDMIWLIEGFKINNKII